MLNQNEKTYKVTFAGRMDPTLKDELNEEARELGVTPSSYVEALLTDRQEYTRYRVIDRLKKVETELQSLKNMGIRSVYSDPEVENDSDDTIEILQTENEQLEQQIETLQEEKKVLETSKSELEAKVNELSNQNDSLKTQLVKLPVNFSPEEQEEMEIYLDSLGERYEDLTHEQTILAALYAAALNEKSFLTTYSARDYEKTDREKRVIRFNN